MTALLFFIKKNILDIDHARTGLSCTKTKLHRVNKLHKVTKLHENNIAQRYKITGENKIAQRNFCTKGQLCTIYIFAQK